MRGIFSVNSLTSKYIANDLGADLYFNGESIPDEVDVLIRWGSVAKGPTAYQTLNRAEAIKKASDKALCRKILKEAGVAVPEEGEDIFPCIGRPAKHRKGRGFFYCKSQYGVKKAKDKGAVYFSRFYPKQQEFRVHIGGNKVIIYSEKEGDTEKKVWNKHKNGFIFNHLKRSEWNIEIIRLAKQAIKAVGLDFGAVDILANPSEPDFPPAVVCEINTAPALSPYAIKKYCQYFERVIDF